MAYVRGAHLGRQAIEIAARLEQAPDRIHGICFLKADIHEQFRR